MFTHVCPQLETCRRLCLVAGDSSDASAVSIWVTDSGGGGRVDVAWRAIGAPRAD